MQKGKEDDLIELGLLLFVMGLTAVVIVLSLILVSARESTIASSLPLTVFSAAAIAGLLASLLIFVRKLKRFIDHR